MWFREIELEIQFSTREREIKQLIEELSREKLVPHSSGSCMSTLMALIPKVISSLGHARSLRTRPSRLRKIAVLQKVVLLQGLSRKQLEQISLLSDELQVPAGKRLATTGDPGNEFFIIAEGRAIVTTARGRKIYLGPGDFFGEMSLVDGESRSSTVEAATLMHLFVVGPREFWQLLSIAPPLARKIMCTLSRRVRDAERAVSV